jgi:hypothetical protein
MATRYLDKAELKLLLDISGTGQDTLLDAIIESAESIFDTLIAQPSGLISSSHTEDFAVNDTSKPWTDRNRVFELGAYKPTAVTTINGVSAGTIDVDYILDGQRLEFKDTKEGPTAFPYRFRIVYTAGITAANLAAVPTDIKTAIKTLASAIYATRKASGVASFKQDLLSINYKDTNVLDTILDPAEKNTVQLIAQKYTVHNTIIG